MGAYGGFMGGFGEICHKAQTYAAQGIECYFLRKIVYDKPRIMTSPRGRGCGVDRFLSRRGWGDRQTRFWQLGFDAPSAFQPA